MTTKKDCHSYEEDANWFSRITFSYLNPIIDIGGKRQLTVDDLHSQSNCDSSQVLSLSLKDFLKRNTLLWSLIFMMKWRLVVVAFAELLSTGLPILIPLFIEQLLIWLQSPDRDTNIGYVWAVAFFFATLFTTLFKALQLFHAFRIWIQVRTVLSSMIYNKTLKLSTSARQSASAGQINNLMSNDTERIGMFTMQVSRFYITPLAIAIIMWQLSDTLGAGSAMAGLGVIIISMPLLVFLIMRLRNIIAERLKLADLRLKLTNEVLQGMQVIRAYAWEPSMKEQINNIRQEEIDLLRRFVYYQAVFTFAFFIIPTLVTIVCFSIYTSTGGELTTPVVFKALGFFNALRMPILGLPFAFAAILNASVSFKRISNFLSRDEILQEENNDDTGNAHNSVILFEKACYQYRPVDENDIFAESTLDKKKKDSGKELTNIEEKKDSGKELTKIEVQNTEETTEIKSVCEEEKVEEQKEEKASLFSLKDISLKVYPKQLFGIIGRVASGKSTLLEAILGEMHKISGKRYLKQRDIAYVAQSPWIQNSTLKDNILFGKDFDPELYSNVVNACCLQQDFDILPAGDSTQIGDKGINLSGGQKQRVAIARAAYSQCDIILLDDPLSAVDVHVGTRIFNDCICGIMADKTRVFVTNQIRFLPNCDYIVLVDDGYIAEQGKYDEICSGEKFSQLARENEKIKQSKAVENDVPIKEEESKRKIPKATDEPDEEERASGAVSRFIYMLHFKSMGGWPMIIFIVLICIVSQFFSSVSDVWVGIWTGNFFSESNNFYLIAYFIVATIATFLILIRSIAIAYASVRASRSHHNTLLSSVLRAPLRFFDITPVGRILNRFSKDLDSIDTQLPAVLTNYVSLITMIVSNLIATSSASPYFLIVLSVAIVLFVYVQRRYMTTALSLQRLDSVNKSPVFQQFAETLNGYHTIRAFNKISEFMSKFDKKLNTSVHCFWILRIVFRWAALRIESLNALLVGFCVLLIVLTAGTVDPNLAGIGLNFVLSVGGLLGFTLMMYVELENRMNAVERIHHYSTQIPQEPAWKMNSDNNIPVEWPSSGQVTFDDVTMTYREGMEPALKGLTAKINSHEKIGIVGRTGSGKSSLIRCLFRLYPLETGKITIDGIDISQVGLHKLRKVLGIIPQEPVLFSGTIRTNLDPFNEFANDDIWDVLTMCGLKESIEKGELGLDAKVSEFGDNYSMGQRQLFCLARALLRKPRILLMDEATSSVDPMTDNLITTTVSHSFSDSTVFSIAHRLKTIINSNRVMFLTDGNLTEFGTPQDLISQTNSDFYAMAKSSGLVN